MSDLSFVPNYQNRLSRISLMQRCKKTWLLLLRRKAPYGESIEKLVLKQNSKSQHWGVKVCAKNKRLFKVNDSISWYLRTGDKWAVLLFTRKYRQPLGNLFTHGKLWYHIWNQIFLQWTTGRSIRRLWKATMVKGPHISLCWLFHVCLFTSAKLLLTS